MLSDPNFSSPANVDASVELRKDPQSYKARVRKIVEKSKADLPVGFEMPKAKPLPKLQESVSDLLDDDDFAAYVRGVFFFFPELRVTDVRHHDRTWKTMTTMRNPRRRRTSEKRLQVL
jgi:hypothetical protein